MRQVASLLAGAAIGALGGLVLGEYPFTGWTPYIAGVLFALVVTEVMLTISRTHGPLLGIGGGVFSAGGLGWAVWISSGRGIEPIPGGGWIAIALGFVVAMVRGFLPNRRTAPVPQADQADAASPLDLLDEFIAPPGSATIVGSPAVRLLERPEPPGGDRPAGAAPSGSSTGASKPAVVGAPKAPSKTTAKAPSKAASKATAKAASPRSVKAGSEASSSAKKAPAKSGAKTSAGSGKSTAAGKVSQKVSKKAASPARGGSSRTSGNSPAKAAVKKAESPAPRSRRGGR